VIINKDSPLRRIPTALERRQALFVEGIRYSIDMAEVAYNRLRATLIVMGSMKTPDAENPDHISAMLDAWSIVDSLNRLRRLVENLPGSKGKMKSPVYRLFLAATEKIPELRNTVQHLDTAIQEGTDDLNWAVWGSLSWGMIDPEKNQVVTCMFLAGIAMGSRPMVNPINRKLWHLPVDSVTVERGGVAVCLSDAMRRVAILAKALEDSLSTAFADQLSEEDRRKTHGADCILRLVMRVAPEQIVPEGTPDPEPELPLEGNHEDSGENEAPVSGD
jgi:hypothetical protein